MFNEDELSLNYKVLQTAKMSLQKDLQRKKRIQRVHKRSLWKKRSQRAKKRSQREKHLQLQSIRRSQREKHLQLQSICRSQREKHLQKKKRFKKKKRFQRQPVRSLQIETMDLGPDVFDEEKVIIALSSVMEEFYKSKTGASNDCQLGSSSSVADVVKKFNTHTGQQKAKDAIKNMKQVFATMSLTNPTIFYGMTLGSFAEAFVCTAKICPCCGGELKLVQSAHVFEAPMCDVACASCQKFYEVKACFKDQQNDDGQPGFLFNPKSIIALVSEKDGVCRDYAGVFLVWDIHRGYFNAFCKNLQETNNTPTMDIPHACVEFFDRESTFETYFQNIFQTMAYSEFSGSVKMQLFKENSHSIQTSSYINLQRETRRNVDCSFFQRGHCKFGDKCRYKHDPTKRMNRSLLDEGDEE